MSIQTQYKKGIFGVINPTSMTYFYLQAEGASDNYVVHFHNNFIRAKFTVKYYADYDTNLLKYIVLKNHVTVIFVHLTAKCEMY